MKVRTYLNWRIAWYSVVIWLLAFLVGGFVILPWYYLTLPLVVFLVTFFYFRRVEIFGILSGGRLVKPKDRVFSLGLGVALVWFLVIVVLSFIEIAEFYYFNFGLYFSDPRNWLVFPLILLTPVVYAIILENRRLVGKKRRKVKKFIWARHLGSLAFK